MKTDEAVLGNEGMVVVLAGREFLLREPPRRVARELRAKLLACLKGLGVTDTSSKAALEKGVARGNMLDQVAAMDSLVDLVFEFPGVVEVRGEIEDDATEGELLGALGVMQKLLFDPFKKFSATMTTTQAPVVPAAAEVDPATH